MTWFMHTGHGFNEGRFTRAVVPQKAVAFAGENIKRDTR